MQSLGLSDSTPRSEGRLKTLFWPSIQSGADVDYLGSQGYWVCSAVAVLTLLTLLIMGHALSGILMLLFFYLGGVGVRERSSFAAVVVFLMYAINMLLAGPGVLSILLSALLLANVRATMIASRWKPESEEAALPPRFNTTFADKFADTFPQWLWPKVRFGYYLFSTVMLVLVIVGAGYMHSQTPLTGQRP